jgi:pimeloyl-ACP methyl ester carboxylesterase
MQEVTMIRTLALFALTGSVAFSLGCADEDVLAPDSRLAPVELKKSTGPQVIEGKTGPGSLYKLFLPAVWNGDLVIYAHGYVAPDEPIALPQVDPLPQILTGFGYGVAYSSFSENGYAIKDAVQRTRQLRGIFASQFGMPDKTYLVGHSEGAIISLMLAEKNPKLFDGALPMCGLVGGGTLQVEYLLNLRVLFDFFFPGVIPGGGALDVPEGLDFETQVVPAVTVAMLTDPVATFQLAAVDQIQIQSGDIFEIIEWVLSALFYNVVGTDDLLGRTHGRTMASNVNTIYTVGGVPHPVLNHPVIGVERFEATPDAANYLEHWYQPTGKLKIPVLTLHTTRDGAVPFFHEAAYAGIAAAAGGSDMLVQRAVNRFGHCDFEVDPTLPFVQTQAFLDLVTWVEFGVKPAP